MLANNLIPRLKGLEINDKSSIGTRRKDKSVGDPDGKNKLKKFTSCFNSPIKIEPRNTVQDKRKVINTWLVIAYPKGNIPNIFEIKTKVNSKNIKGK